METEDGESVGTALYAPHQTIIYTAPPVANGKIPKNVYGNLDVYVPSMVPLGGIHVPHPETARAARILGIDYADAVTGFSFKGRHGTAITNGAVVATEYREAVVEVIKAIEDERARAEEDKRSLAALKMWKRFFAGLRIKERIEGYDIEGGGDMTVQREMEPAEVEVEDEDEDEDEGGGFFFDRDIQEIAQPTAARRETEQNSSGLRDDGEGGGFIMSDDEDDEVELQPPIESYSRIHSEYDDYDGSASFQLEEGPRKTNQEDQIYMHLSEQNNDQELLDQGGNFLSNDQNADLVPIDASRKLSGPMVAMLETRGGIDAQRAPHQKHHMEEEFQDLPADELEEARMLQQLYEAQEDKNLLPPQEEVTRTPVSSSKGETTAQSKQKTSILGAEAHVSDSPVVEEEDSDSSEDKGSLLSHDPDDEDADPEWLA